MVYESLSPNEYQIETKYLWSVCSDQYKTCIDTLIPKNYGILNKTTN